MRDIEDKEDLGIVGEGLNFVREVLMCIIKKVNFREGIRNFVGFRVNFDKGDFIVEENENVKGFIDVVGMKLLGLLLVLVIVFEVINILGKVECKLEEKINFNGKRD